MPKHKDLSELKWCPPPWRDLPALAGWGGGASEVENSPYSQGMTMITTMTTGDNSDHSN